MIPTVYKSEDGYSIKGLEPPGLINQPTNVRLMFWKWAVELGLKYKDQDTSQGIGANGRPLAPISAYTKAHRKSAMTASGRGDPDAPPLTPGWEKSRTRSLLTGRAYVDHAAFWWKFDWHTGESWARVLEMQAGASRDVFGLSPKSLTKLKMATWQRYASWEAGQRKAPVPPRPEPPTVTRPIFPPPPRLPGSKKPPKPAAPPPAAKPVPQPIPRMPLPEFLKKKPPAVPERKPGIVFRSLSNMVNWIRNKF